MWAFMKVFPSFPLFLFILFHLFLFFGTWGEQWRGKFDALRCGKWKQEESLALLPLRLRKREGGRETATRRRVIKEEGKWLHTCCRRRQIWSLPEKRGKGDVPATWGVSGGAVKYVSAAIHTFLATKKISSVSEVRQIFIILDRHCSRWEMQYVSHFDP